MGEARKLYRREFLVTPALSLSAYSSGDAIAGLTTLSQAVRSADQSGLVEQLIIEDADAQSAAMDVLLFESAVAAGTDNAAYALSKPDMKKLVGLIRVQAADYVIVGARSIARVSPAIHIQMNASQHLFAQIVSRGTPTYTASDSLQLRLVMNQD